MEFQNQAPPPVAGTNKVRELPQAITFDSILSVLIFFQKQPTDDLRMKMQNDTTNTMELASTVAVLRLFKIELLRVYVLTIGLLLSLGGHMGPRSFCNSYPGFLQRVVLSSSLASLIILTVLFAMATLGGERGVRVWLNLSNEPWKLRPLYLLVGLIIQPVLWGPLCWRLW